MSTPFTPQKQLAFGSIVGGLLRTLQNEHDLSQGDVAAIMLSMAAGQGSVAGWNLESFIRFAAHAWEKGPGKVRANAPPPR